MTRALAIAALVVGALSATSAHAQTDEELEAARATFAEGVEHIAAESWSEAETAFRSVIAVRDVPPVRYNLALALSHLGQLGESVALTEAVLADPETDEATRGQAEQLLSELSPRIGRLRISVIGGGGGSVTLDEEAIEPEHLAAPIVVEPGPHRVALQRAGETVAAEDVDVAAGATEEVRLRGAPLAPVEPDPEPTGGGGDVTSEPWFWAVIGGAAALVVTAIILGVVLGTSGTEEPVQGTLMPGVLTFD